MIKGKEFDEEQKIETSKAVDVGSVVKPVATTTAGAGVGVVGAIAGITTAAAFEIVLPVALCLWACGITGGAIGLTFGMGRKKK